MYNILYTCVEWEREKRETFLYSKPLNYYSAVIAFASEGYTNTKKKITKKTSIIRHSRARSIEMISSVTVDEKSKL